MANKRFLLLACLVFLSAFAPAFLSSEENKFEQRIEWKADATALEYKVEVQLVSGGEISSYRTDNTYLVLSLTVGSYRYRVHAIDFLGREAAVSEWRTFEVFKAATPEVDIIQETVSFTPEEKNIKLPLVILNINRQTSVELVNTATKKSVEVTFELNTSSAGKESPSSEVFRSSSVTVPAVAEGVYFLRIKNPSGLSADSANINFVEEKSSTKPEVVEVAVEDSELIRQKDEEIDRLTKQLAKKGSTVRNMQALLALGPGFAPYDGSLEKLTDLSVVPQAAFKFTVLPFSTKSGKIRLGMEFSACEVLAPVFNEYISSFLSASFANASFVYQQKIFKDSISFSLKLGGGLSLIALDYKYTDSYTGRETSSWIFRPYFAAVAGLAVTWKPASHLLVEAGGDVEYLFSASMPTLAILPYIGIGVHW